MLPAFFGAVLPALQEATEGQWSVLCVDDGSIDTTFHLIAEQHALDGRVMGIRLSRNFGHQAAVSVGLQYARAEYVGITDCDLQDPVDVLIQLYRTALSDRLDVCYGVRRRRDAPVLLRACYTLFYLVIQKAADHAWPRDAGDFCVMSARCQRTILSLPEHSRMLRGLRSWVGFRQGGVAYDRPARLHGESKYNFGRLTALALQGLISFSTIPLRLSSLVGLAMGAFSILFGIVVLINRLFPKFTVFHYWVGQNPGVATVLVFLSLAFSVLFVCLGIIGEYLAVLLQEIKRRPIAIIEATAGQVPSPVSGENVFASRGAGLE